MRSQNAGFSELKQGVHTPTVPLDLALLKSSFTRLLDQEAKVAFARPVTLIYLHLGDPPDSCPQQLTGLAGLAWQRLQQLHLGIVFVLAYVNRITQALLALATTEVEKLAAEF